MNIQTRILVVVNRVDLFDRIESFLERDTFEVNRVTTGSGALVLAGNVPYRLVIIQSPLPDLTLGEFLTDLRSLDSTCASAGVIVLTEEADPVLPPGLGGAPVTTLSAETPAPQIHKSISKLLGVAARRKSRILVNIEVEVEAGHKKRVLQSINLSESGLLLRGGRSLPLGAKVAFSFRLPGVDEAITGTAEVVRRSAKAEAIEGIGVHFLDLGERDQARLREFVHSGPGRAQKRLQAAGA